MIHAGRCQTLKICILSSFEDLLLKDTGPSVRIYELAKGLASLNNDVHIVLPGEFDGKRGDRITIHSARGVLPKSFLKAICRLVGISRPTSLYFYDPSFIVRIAPMILQSDVVQIEQQTAGGFLIPIISKIWKKPLVVDCHDVFQAVKVPHASRGRRILETFLEKIAYTCATLILTVSETEKTRLTSIAAVNAPIDVVPNGVDTHVFTGQIGNSDIKDRYGLRESGTVIFVGNMEYMPNLEALKLIETRIAPIVKRTNRTKFLIVGRSPQRKESNGLIFTGVVDNLAEYLAASDVAIAPLLHGSGTRLKILEYFSCGLPVVSTSIGVEGLDVKNGVHVIVEDNIDAFGLRIIELLNDKERSEKLGSAAKILVNEKYDWKNIAEHLNASMEDMIRLRGKEET
jgi:glycosyltransferase involved in cell wall biosynthesis